MVRGGGYGRGAGTNAAGRYNAPSAGSGSTAGVRTWARARLYSKNVANTVPRYQPYYSSARPAGGMGLAGSVARRGRNFAVSRGRYEAFQYPRVGYYRYFPRMTRGGGYARGGTVVGGGRAQAAENISERPTASRITRGGGASAAVAGGSRGGTTTGRGRGSRGGVGRGGGVRGFARGVFRRRERGGTFRGRGRGRGAGLGRGGRRGAGGALNKETLDAELDKYMGEDNIKKRLDNELEKYFSRTGGSAAAVGAGAAGTAAAAGGGEQGAGVVGGAGPAAAVGSVVDPAAGGAGTAAAGAAPGSGDATTNGTLKTGGMDVSMDNSL